MPSLMEIPCRFIIRNPLRLFYYRNQQSTFQPTVFLLISSRPKHNHPFVLLLEGNEEIWQHSKTPTHYDNQNIQSLKSFKGKETFFKWISGVIVWKQAFKPLKFLSLLILAVASLALYNIFLFYFNDLFRRSFGTGYIPNNLYIEIKFTT